jgi:proliferating cell nuclear antigen
MSGFGGPSGNILTIQTVQITPFKTLITALKDILLETNMTFRPDGIHVINMDKSHTILVHLFLAADKFERYECNEEKIIIGLNVFHLFRLISNVNNDDTLTICIENGDYSDGIVSQLTLKFENNTISQCKTQKLRLIEPDTDELEYPDVKFSSIINLPSVDFQKIIRDMSCISDKVEIKSVGNDLIFKCNGQFANSEILRSEKDGAMNFVKQEASKIIQGEFSLKTLSYFIKCTNLCSQVEIYLENDLPLVVKYDVASLGEIKLCVSSIPSC